MREGDMMETRRYPLDFDALTKGSVIRLPEIEQALGATRDTEGFGLAVLRLRGRIEEEMEERGTPATVCVRDGDLHILSDEDAAEYNPAQFSAGLRRAVRSHRRLLQVDAGQLSPLARSRFDRRAEVQGKILQSVARARRELAVVAHRRSTPGALGGIK
jgi:hypothetical protein